MSHNSWKNLVYCFLFISQAVHCGGDRVDALPTDDPLTHSQSELHWVTRLIGCISCRRFLFWTLQEAIHRDGWRTFALILLRGLENLSECRSELLLCCVYNEGNAHINSLSVTHTHHIVLAKPNQQDTLGARRGGEPNSIRLLIWGCVWKWRGSVYMLVRVYPHTQHHVKAHFCLKQPYKYFYLKDYQQLVWLQLESSLGFCAAAAQR